MISMVSRLAIAAGVAGGVFAGTAQAQSPFQCPRKGGDIVFALEARVPSLDQHASNSSATRNVAANIFESLVTRDEKMGAMLQLAASLDEAADGMSYTFKLRPGVKFHNGKVMTSADVVASFDRYRKIGVDRSILDAVEGWEAPDASTFVIKMKRALPTFIEQLSSFTVPIAIIPSELADAPAQQLQIVGSGPFKLEDFRADSAVKLRRFDDYVPDTRYTDLSGFAGYRVACVDTVTFRMMTEPAARTAALETGEIHGVEDVPLTSQKRLGANKDIKLTKLNTFTLNVGYPNFLAPPTDNVKVRQAMMAAMDFEEVMEAASEGEYKLNAGYQFPGQPYYSEAGKQFVNQKNVEKAKQLLKEAGYRNEKIVLLTNREFPYMYNTSLVMLEQLKAAGMNAELLVLDWPAALQKSIRENDGWNFFYTGWITVVALGGPQTMRQMGPPASVNRQNTVDEQFMTAFKALSEGRTLDDRKAAFAKAQERALELGMAFPFGSMPKTQAVRANVENFRPYYVPRMSNVWLKQ